MSGGRPDLHLRLLGLSERAADLEGIVASLLLRLDGPFEGPAAERLRQELRSRQHQIRIVREHLSRAAASTASHPVGSLE